MCPVYEYECPDCQIITTKISSIKENIKVVKCKICNGEAHKILSSGSFTINGYNANNGYSKSKEN